jgi:hypothetical protein
MILRHLQQCGHKPIILLGGGTTKVGDPSGKDASRKMLSNGPCLLSSELSSAPLPSPPLLSSPLLSSPLLSSPLLSSPLGSSHGALCNLVDAFGQSAREGN